MHGSDLLILLVQVGLILALSRVMGILCTRIQQPQVMGEMIAGVMLGPSLLGWLAPGFYGEVFPPASREVLRILSQFGVIFFLFLVGLDFDPNLLRKRGRSAAVISITSIMIPFALGVGLAYLFYDLFEPAMHRHFIASALFMGAAISVTAFPVLARILTERNLHKTPVGAIAITCAAVDDVLAWCMLAFVSAVAQARGPRSAVWTAALSAAFVAFLLLAVRPGLRGVQRFYERRGALSHNVVAVIFLLLLGCTSATEYIGIHALFGAFVFGFIMPKGTAFVRHLSEKIEDFTVVLLLPIFFAYAGLNTDLFAIQRGGMWGHALLVLAVACLGKFGGAAATARLTGIDWRQSSAIGILMNTRGLMELVILTAGLQLKVISPPIYAMMVIMAIVTTAMTTPLLHWVYPQRLMIGEPPPGQQPAAPDAFPVLVAVSLPRSGPALLRLGEAVSGPDGAARVTALALRAPVDRDAYRSGLSEEPIDALQPLLADAQARHIPVEPLSFVSLDVAADIATVAASRHARLVLMGFHKPVVGGTMLGGTVHRVLSTCPVDVGVFVDRGLHSIKRILVPYLGSRHDRLALKLASRLARNAGAQITVLHVVAPGRDGATPTLDAKGNVDQVFQDPTQAAPVTFRIVEHAAPVDAVLQAAAPFDLIMIGVAEEWGLESHLFGFRPERIARDTPTSLLIVRQHG